MKIMHLVDSLGRGGQEVFLANLAICQVRMGHEVVIICTTSTGVLEDYVKNNGVMVVSSLVSHKSIKSKLEHLNFLVKQFKIDFLHAHNRQPLVFAVFSLSFLRCKVINTRHGDKVRGLSWTFSALFAHRIVNVSEELYKSSNILNRTILCAKNVVIHNGIPLRVAQETGNNIGNIIMVGRLNPVKNYELAIEIVKECKLRGINIHLTVVGDGPEKDKLAKDISLFGLESDITFLGDRENVHELLCSSDIFLMTSKSEGHSIALLEAVAAGLPCVVSDVGGNSEIVTHGSNGFVIKLGNCSGYVDAIAELISDRSFDC